MHDRTHLALKAITQLRDSPAIASLSRYEQDAMARDLDRIASALGGDVADGAADDAGEPDPYAAILATPADLQRDLDRGRAPASGSNAGANGAKPAAPASTGPSRAVDRIGQQTAAALEAIDFPTFVAGLVTGTFDAIVRSTSEQMREYAALVASLSQSVDDFSRDNVTDNQVRDHLAESYPADLRVELPEAGKRESPRLRPQKNAEGTSPPWLAKFGLEGQELDAQLTEGTLLRSGRRDLAEQRMQSLANMVLMGISRVVVNKGNITARLQFHAKAADRTEVELQAMSMGQKAGIAARQTQLSQGSTAMVSTVSANVQANSQVRADLMGEVNVEFSTETFPLERFADSAAIQLINRHARWSAPASATAPPNSAAPAPAVTPAPVPPTDGGDTP